MTKPMISICTIMGVPRITVVYTLQTHVEHAQGEIPAAGPLLVVGGADHRHQHTQHHADDQGHHRQLQGGQNAPDIQFPSGRPPGRPGKS